MNKNEFLTLTDEQVAQIVAATHDLADIPPLPRPCPQITTLACGEEGPICSAC